MNSLATKYFTEWFVKSAWLLGHDGTTLADLPHIVFETEAVTNEADPDDLFYVADTYITEDGEQAVERKLKGTLH